MTLVRDRGPAADLAGPLEAGVERLRAAGREIEQAASSLEAAIALIRAQPALPGGPAIERLIEAQHARLAQTLIAALGTDRATTSPETPASSETPAHYPFMMDAAARVARIGRRRIPLTESEFKVLEMLWEEMPAPVSRPALMDRLYGGPGEATEAVIDMFIFKIRSKLRAAGCTDAAIRAVRGAGWVLELRGEPDADTV
jgi:DNA-binding response OmpR family regulator